MMGQEVNSKNGHYSATYDAYEVEFEGDRDRVSPPIDDDINDDIIDADILDFDTFDTGDRESFANSTQHQQFKRQPPPPPPILSQQIAQNLQQLEAQIEDKFDRLQEGLKKAHIDDRRRMMQGLYETDERIGRKFRLFHDNLSRLEIKIDALLSEQKAKESRRVMLILMSILVAGIAYITVIFPLMNRTHYPTNSPPLQTPDSIPSNPSW